MPDLTTDATDWRQAITAICGGDDLGAMEAYAKAQGDKAFKVFAMWSWLELQSDWLDAELRGDTKEERFARALLNADAAQSAILAAVTEESHV